MSFPQFRLPITIMACLGAAGCQGNSGALSTADIARISSDYASLAPGTARSEVFRRMSGVSRTQLSEMYVGNIHVEEWRLHATSQDSTGTGQFDRYVYFADSALFECRDIRWDYRADAQLPMRLKRQAPR